IRPRLSFSDPRAHRDLHSFPTRRSSDLRVPSLPLTSCLANGGFFVSLRASLTPDLDRSRPASPPGMRAPSSSRGPARVHASSSRSEEHTSELQSLAYLVCRLLLEKKKII